jgi:radical SAM protein with 4Fe4S-binding SPASM domain
MECDLYKGFLRKTRDEHRLLNVDWELTVRCNQRCGHCFHSDAPASELTLPEIRGILDQLADAGCLFVTFTGGEIFLRNDLFDICAYAKHKRFAIRLFTNGTLIGEHTADCLAALGPLSVEISLYGIDAMVHEAVTGLPGSFEKTMNAIRLLKSRNVRVVLKNVVMTQNVHQFDALCDFAKSIESKLVFSEVVVPRLNGDRQNTLCSLSDDQYRKWIRLNDAFCSRVEERKQVLEFDPRCSAGLNSLFIAADGQTYPCTLIRTACGSLKSFDLEAIWNAPVLRRMREITFKDLKECRNCDLIAYCSRCPGAAYLEGGSIYAASDSYCRKASMYSVAYESEKAKH